MTEPDDFFDPAAPKAANAAAATETDGQHDKQLESEAVRGEEISKDSEPESERKRPKQSVQEVPANSGMPSKQLVKIVEALLFLSPEPVGITELAQAAEVTEEEMELALGTLTEAREKQGVVIKELAGGYTMASMPEAEHAARRLLGRSRTAPLTAAQAETLAVVAYLQPVSRPDIARIRGVASESATLALVERGLIEEAGRSQFGAVLYRVTPLFLKVFGLPSTDDLPDPAQWDPTPEERENLRERLLSAGDQRLESTKT